MEPMPRTDRPIPMVSADTLSAAAGHLTRNWGEYGYKLGLEATTFDGHGFFFCRHSDGSTFRFMVDRWGNVTDLPAREELQDAVSALRSESEAV